MEYNEKNTLTYQMLYSKKSITISLRTETLRQLDALCKKNGCSRSQLINQFLESALDIVSAANENITKKSSP